jgi:MFS family permease
MSASSDAPPDTSDRSTPGPASSGSALAGLALSILLASLGTSGANVGLPTFARVFGASFAAVQWVVLAYLLAVTTLVVGAGRLGDLVGRRRLLEGGLALFIAASLHAGFAPSLPVLVLARGAQGAGAAVMMALSLAFIGDAVSPSRVGRAMGLMGTMSAVGTALGPSLGGTLISWPGWRALFLINVPLGLVTLWLVHRDLPERRADRAADRTFDAPGTMLLAMSLGALALALTTGRQRTAGASAALLVGAALGAVLFVRRQVRARVPLIPPSLLRDGALRVSLATNAIVATVMMSTLIVGPFYLTRALGLAPAAMGLVMTVGPIITALAGVPAGHLVDRAGSSRAMLAGLVTMAVGSALLAALPGAAGIAGYLGPIAFLTAGYALFQAANNTAVMATASSGERGLVAGVLGLSRNLGLITGASAMGAVFALASGASDLTIAAPDSVARGMRVTFAVAAALVVAPIALAIARRARTCYSHPNNDPTSHVAGPSAMKALAGLERR